MRRVQVAETHVLSLALLVLSLAGCKYHGSVESQQIARTNAKLTITCGALEAYLEDSVIGAEFELGQLLEGQSPYLRGSDTLRDEWQRNFVLSSNGGEYTLTSLGPDGLAATPDDLQCRVPNPRH